MSAEKAKERTPPLSYRTYRLVIVLLALAIYAAATWGAFGHGPLKKLEGPAKSATSWVKDAMGVD